MKKILALSLIVTSILFSVFLISSKKTYYNPESFLLNSWKSYKKAYLYKDGRIIDPARNDSTISEGQSYAMLQSVWMNDKETFDLVWDWTKTNLNRNQDNLLAWKWGKKQDGSYGFVEEGDQNSASDGDTDIALALIFAYKRWNDIKYLEDAKNLLTDIWKYETVEVSKKRYLIAGNWAQDDNKIIINPSYFAPYAWRIFAKFDTQNDWNSLIDPAYELLEKTVIDKLDNKSASGLPPDWVAIDKNSGSLEATGKPNMDTNYSYDALRIPWRVALDYQWNNEVRAKTYLLSAFDVLKNDYKSTHKLAGSYTHDGSILISQESPALYATSLGYFVMANKEISKDIYKKKVLKLYATHLSYYDQNWLWFGYALYNNKLINLADE